MEENKKNRIPNVPNLRFEFSGSWKECSLSSIVTRIKRKNIGNISNLPLTISAQYGLIDQESFFGKKVASSNLENYYLLFKGDFAYNKSYSKDYPWGAIKRLDLYDCGVVSNLYICFLPNKSIESDYLVHYFESDKWYKQISDIAGEGARNHGLLNMSIDDFFRTKHYLPSYTEQLKIGHFLNLIKERIETQNKIIEKMKSLIKPLFDNLNTCANHRIQIYDIGKYYSAESIAWDEINDFGDPVIIYGQLFTEYKYVVNRIVSKTKKELTTLTTSNDLLFPSSTTVDALSLISPASIKMPGVMIGGDMFGIRVNDEYDSDYFSFLINCSYKKEISKYAQGSTIIHLHYDDIKNFKILICDKKKQVEISRIMNLILKKIELEEEILSNYKKQKQFFLDNLFI